LLQSSRVLTLEKSISVGQTQISVITTVIGPHPPTIIKESVRELFPHEIPVLSFERRNQVENKTEIRPVIPFTRIIFVVSALLAVIAGIQLYLLTEHTAQYFAWTIKNPLSAAFLGAGYWTGVTLLLFSTAEHAWSNIRIAIVAVCTFAPLVLVATLLNLSGCEQLK
jgi:hypothetical protein